jgi:tRNA threonylcarbamoyladenosine biosynthesis protein TsaB
MNLLAIDTAASVLSVAFTAKGVIYYSETKTENTGGGVGDTSHSELVMDYINLQMKKSRLEPEDLQGVLCMNGPGSFTGLRIGFSIAKGLVLALGIPFVPVPTFDCIALGAFTAHLPAKPFTGIIMPVISVKKNSFFCALYQNGKCLKTVTDAAPEQIAGILENIEASEKILLTGPGAILLNNLLSKKQLILPRENHGYAKELLEYAQMNKIFSKNNSAYLYEGPVYSQAGLIPRPLGR